MREKPCFDIIGRDILFRPLQLTSHEVWQTLRYPRVLFFAVLLFLILLIFDAGDLLPHMPWWQAALIWMIAVGLQIGSYAAIVLLWGRLQANGWVPVIFFPAVGLMAFMLTYSVTASNVMLLTGRSSAQVLVPGIALTGYIFAAISEALYFVFVLPQLLREVRARRENAPGRCISVAGQQFSLDDILTLRGQEHFVLVTTHTGAFRLRARLRDLVSQTSEADGILAHRSYWVARHAIRALERTGNCDRIVTVTGEVLKVAQPRKAAVRDWVGRHVLAPDQTPPPAALFPASQPGPERMPSSGRRVGPASAQRRLGGG